MTNEDPSANLEMSLEQHYAIAYQSYGNDEARKRVLNVLLSDTHRHPSSEHTIS